MSRAIALVAVTVATAAACGAVTPEEEARTFLLALVDCMEENRDAMAASFGNAEALATEQMDEMCDQVDRDALSEEALPLMEDAGKRAFGKAMPTIMGAAMASVFTGGELDDAAAIGAVDALVAALREAAEEIQP